MLITESCLEGVEFEDLNPELGEYFGTEEGVLVMSAEAENSLQLRAGDVVQAVDGREVEGTSHLRRILLSYEPTETFSLRIVRRGESMTLEGLTLN